MSRITMCANLHQTKLMSQIQTPPSKKIVVTNKVIGIITRTHGIMPDTLKSTSKLDQLGIDSLDRIELAMFIEEEFDVTIPDDNALKFSTVQDIVDYVICHSL